MIKPSPQNRLILLRNLSLLAVFIIAITLSGCANLANSGLPTPFPTEYLPTLIALTIEAGQISTAQPALTEQPVLDTPKTPTVSPTPTPSPTIPPTATLPRATATSFTVTPSPGPTAISEIPNAEIEIRNLGALSKVTSPLPIYAYLRPGAGGKVRIELLGEDGRMLTRHIKTFSSLPPRAWAVMQTEIEFEIAATAESGRLQISVEDENGRITALNYVPLILMSIGDPDIIPPIDVLAPIVIQQPTRRSLIQGGVVLVSGIARPGSDQPLVAKLIAPDGSEVGMRLVNVDNPIQNGYGSFAAEIPYSVEKTTPVLLVITEGRRSLNDIIHLTSQEIMISP